MVTLDFSDCIVHVKLIYRGVTINRTGPHRDRTTFDYWFTFSSNLIYSRSTRLEYLLATAASTLSALTRRGIGSDAYTLAMHSYRHALITATLSWHYFVPKVTTGNDVPLRSLLCLSAMGLAPEINVMYVRCTHVCMLSASVTVCDVAPRQHLRFSGRRLLVVPLDLGWVCLADWPFLWLVGLLEFVAWHFA